MKNLFKKFRSNYKKVSVKFKLLVVMCVCSYTVHAQCTIQDQTISVTNPVICTNDFTTITTGSSEVGVDYYLRDDSDNSIVAGPIVGTGGPLSFNTGPLTTTTNFNVYARSGASGDGGVDFDGDNDIANAGYVPFQIDNFTIEVRFKYRAGADQQQFIVGFGTMVVIGVSNGELGYFKNHNSYAGVMPLVDEQWYHVALVWRAGIPEMYVDGILQSTPNYPGALSLTYNSNFVVGGGSNLAFDGVIDEVRVWTAPRLQSEIDLMKDSCLTGSETDLYLYYNMEEGTGTTLNDLTSNGYNATMYLGPTWTVGTGIVCTGCIAEMSTLVTVNVEQPSTGSETILACDTYTWPTNGTTYNTSGAYTHTLTNAMGCDSVVTLNLTIGQSTLNSLPVIAICPGDSALIFGSYESVAGTYLDTLQSVHGCDSILSIDLIINPLPVQQTVSATQTAFCDSGAVAISVDSTEIGVEYSLYETATNNLADGPIEGTGNSIFFNPGMISTTTDYYVNAVNKLPTALQLDGVDDWVRKADNTCATYKDNDVTIELWFNWDGNITQAEYLIFNGAGSGHGYGLRISTAGELRALFAGIGFLNTGYIVTPGQWTHVALTGDASDNWTIYVDGVFISSAVMNNNPPVSNFSIGGPEVPVALFGGLIDEVRVWERALTQGEIQSNMSTCLNGNETDLVAYFPFENGFLDVTGNGHTVDSTGYNNVSPWSTNAVGVCGTCNSDMLDTITIEINSSYNQAVTATICSGDSYTFPDGSVQNNITAQVIQTSTLQTVNSCDSIIVTTVNTNNPSIQAQTITPAQQNFCDSGAGIFSVTDSETGINYYLRDDATDAIVAGPVAGNDTNITITGPTVTSTTTYNVYGEKVYRSLGLDGNNDFWLNANAPVYTQNDLTIELWVYWDGDLSTTQYIVGIGAQNSRGYHIKLDNLGQPYLLLGGVGTLNSNQAITPGVWTHLAITGSPTNLWTIYINGQAASSATMVANPAVFSSNFLIGATGSATEVFGSRVDELRVWSTYRSQAEISANMAGCFDGTEANLEAYYNFEGTVNDQTANGWDLMTFTASAFYPQGYQACVVCSSEMLNTVTVVIDSSHAQTTNTTICQGDSVLIFGSYETVAGVYIDSLLTINGCDSIETVELIVNPAYSDTINAISICPGDSTLIFGNYETVAGTYTNNMTTINGCDSIETVELIVNPAYNDTINTISICMGDSVLIFGNYENVAGVYTNTLSTVNACDSIETILLNVTTVDTAVNVSGFTLTANASGASYQWLDCDNNYVIIGGATNQAYTPSVNGNYAVSVTQNGCTDTSACYNIVITGINDVSSFNQVVVYPNPVNNFVIINFAGLKVVDQVMVSDLRGRIIYQSGNVSTNKLQIDLSEVTKGVYLLRIDSESKSKVYKVIKN